MIDCRQAGGCGTGITAKSHFGGNSNMPQLCQKLPQNCHETAIKLPFLMPNSLNTETR
jgi:hypothetical protein